MQIKKGVICLKILNFGSCNIDYVYNVRKFVRAGETISALSTSEHPGGKGLNQAVAAARAGGNVFLAGNIGEDGLFLKELLESSGVDTKYLKINKARTGNAIIQIDKIGENCINSRRKVQDIASDVGYSDASHTCITLQKTDEQKRLFPVL